MYCIETVNLFLHAAVEYLLMPERVKKLEGQVGNVLCDLEKISGSIAKLERIGYDLGKVADLLSKLVGFEVIQEPTKASTEGGGSYVS
jgi:hypothetical protein